MSTLVTINGSDLPTNSRADINGNFSTLNTDKEEVSNKSTDSTFASADDTTYPTTLATKKYVDAGGNVNASTTTKGIVEEATAAEVAAGTATGGTGARLFVNPEGLSGAGLFKFGGTGVDGELSVSSGNTNIDCGGESVFVKNYSSISITGTGSVTFINPHANGTVVIIRCKGNATITSSATPAIDASGLGAQGGAGAVVSTDTVTNGSNGSNGAVGYNFWITGGGEGGDNDGVGELKGAALTGALAYKSTNTQYFSRYPFSLFGAGGGGGGARKVSGSTAGTATGGNGGRGGGILIIECAGAWNFTTTNGISVAGNVGGNGTCVTGNRLSAGGGGGGAGGYCLVIYKELTASSGTIVVSGGSGGTGAHIETGGAFQGVDGAGGGSSYTQGTDGTAGVSGGAGTGGSGGSGISEVRLNTEYV